MAGNLLPQTNIKHMSKNWNSNIQFPTDSDFVIRLTDVSFGPSKSSGNPLITAEWEIVAPDEKEIAGEMYNIAGIKSNAMSHLYFVTKTPGEDAGAKEQSANQLSRLTGEGDQPGFLRIAFPDNPEYVEGFNPDNPDQKMLDDLKGLCFYVQMRPDIQQDRKNPTAAQIEAAKKAGVRPEGDVQLNPVTGKPIIKYLPKVTQVFGLAPAVVGKDKPY